MRTVVSTHTGFPERTTLRQFLPSSTASDLCGQRASALSLRFKAISSSRCSSPDLIGFSDIRSTGRAGYRQDPTATALRTVIQVQSQFACYRAQRRAQSPTSYHTGRTLRQRLSESLLACSFILREILVIEPPLATVLTPSDWLWSFAVGGSSLEHPRSADNQCSTWKRSSTASGPQVLPATTGKFSDYVDVFVPRIPLWVVANACVLLKFHRSHYALDGSVDTFT